VYLKRDIGCLLAFYFYKKVSDIRH